MSDKELIQKAMEARENSYSPYSKFKVGAAILTKSGKVYLGTNIENSCYTSNCAERSAIHSAISNGEKEFVKIAIIGSGKNILYPCGICRQVLAELAPNIDIICALDENTYEICNIKTLLPHVFTKNDLT